MNHKIEFILNGKNTEVACNLTKRLLDVLRDDLSLTSVKDGCSEGECGACVVFLNERLVNSCLVPIGNVIGKKVLTLEGFKNTEKFKVIEDAMLQAGAVQCGFCTPGMVMAIEAMLRINKEPSLAEVKEALSGNLCRCTGYQQIFEAVKIISRKGIDLW